MSQETTTTTSSAVVASNRVEKSRQNYSVGRNVVDDVVAKLPDWLRRSLDSSDDAHHGQVHAHKTSTFRTWIDRLREDYRILEAKTHVGSLGKFDKPQARVVAILSCRWANVVVSSTTVSRQHAATSTKTTGRRGQPKEAQDDHVKARQALAIAGATTMQSLDQLCVQVDDLLRPLQQTTTTSASTHAVVPKNQNATAFQRHAAATLSSTKDAMEASSLVSSNSMNNNDNNNNSAIIPDLAIQFGNWIPDAQGVAHKAQQLMTQVEQFISTSVSSHLRTGYAYELQKHRSAYEAACFYIHAKQQDGTTTNTTTMTKKNARKRKRLGGDFDDMGDDDNDHDDLDNMGVSRQLELGHVLKALSSYSCTGYVDLKILKGIVTFLTKLVVKMQEDPKSDSKVPGIAAGELQQQAKLSIPSNRKRNLNTSANCKRIKKGLKHADASHEEARLLQIGRRSDKDDMTRGTRKSGPADDDPVIDEGKEAAIPLLPPKPTFLEWKEQVLADAKRKAKEALGKEDVTELELLMHAANDVLRRHGVLPLLT